MPRVAATFEGKPCRHGHGTTRYLSGKRRCVICTRTYHKTWYHSNIPSRQEYHANYRDENRDQVRLVNRAYEDRNRDARNERNRVYYCLTAPARRAYTRAYWKDRPEEARRHSSLRRGRLREAAGEFTLEQSTAILMAQGQCCAYCDVSEDLHLDHVVPVSRGGSNWPWNLQWLCAFHNQSKLAKTDAEYRRQIGLPEQAWLSLRLWSAALFIPIEVLREYA